MTNKPYGECVEANVCTPPAGVGSIRRGAYFGYEDYDEYPVIFVNWFQAKTYCAVWRGDDLATEAQWEKAAGWDPATGETRTYPWGEELPSVELLNFYEEDEVNDTVRVGSYEAGVSPVGTYDMLGNVWEWTQDWYSDEYYRFSPDTNPTGPEDAVIESMRVVRGSSWGYVEPPRVADRRGIGDMVAANDLGFRCAGSTE